MVFGFGRIEFDGNFLNLNRAWSDFQPQRFTKKSELDMDSGLVETHKFFSKWFINARLTLLDPQEKAQLQRLFEYAEDGSSFTLIRDRNLGAYINFEGGINPTAAPRGLKTNDDVDGTFTRTNVADSAWSLDEGTGLLTLRDGADVPRFPAGKYGAGIQIDGAAVNLITNRISNAAWTKVTMTAATTTETLDPAGNNSNVDKLTATASSATAKFTTGTAKGNEAAGKFWIKSPSGNVSLNLTIETTTVLTNAVTATPVWQELKIQGDTSLLAAGNLKLGIEIVTNGKIVYVWHTPQLFDSAEFDLGTVGPLSTSSITRNAEKILFPSANIINQENGTILFRFNPAWVLGSQGTRTLFQSGASSTNRHVEIKMAATSRIEFKIYTLNGSGTGISENPVVSGITQNQWTTLAVTYNSIISNGAKLYLDGVLDTTSTNDPFSISSVGTNFAIGSTLTGALTSHCAFDEVLITRNVLSANEIAAIHALGIGLGVPKNRWTVQLNDQVWNPRWLHSDVYDIPLLLKEVLT